MKRIFVCAVIWIFIFSLTACASGTTFDGSRTGNENQLMMQYKVFNTTDTQEFELAAGDIVNFEVVSKSGSIDILLQKGEEEPVYEGTDILTSTFQVDINDSGRYILSVTGKNAKGSISVTKEMSESTMEKNNLSKAEEQAEIQDADTITITDKVQEENMESSVEEVDWSDYFDGINGAAVVYDPAREFYQIFHQELALTRRSPCSTFKIVSSLIALEDGIIEPEDSVRTWNREIFWNEEWNRDIDFADAFHTSCVWYFREIVDEIGKDRIAEELEKLQYGNCDSSDWEGRLNTNNSNPVLTGFWIESSLQISPKEQVEVMERIFGTHTDYSEETREQLKQVMRLSGQEETDISIYGKTGMGKAEGIVVDAWFTGFAEKDGKRLYFCVYLGETDNKNVSSTKAREIAVKIVSDLPDMALENV